MNFVNGDIVKTNRGGYKIILYRYFNYYMCRHIFNSQNISSERVCDPEDLEWVAHKNQFESHEELVNFVNVLEQFEK